MDITGDESVGFEYLHCIAETLETTKILNFLILQRHRNKFMLKSNEINRWTAVGGI